MSQNNAVYNRRYVGHMRHSLSTKKPPKDYYFADRIGNLYRYHEYFGHISREKVCHLLTIPKDYPFYYVVDTRDDCRKFYC